MASVTYDDRSFLIDGQRIWLVSGEVHYFRVPSALWRDRLLKAKRGGLNCISTCIPWNYHEPQEGRWELSGEKDLGAFIRLAGDLELYVILRPGPYICGHWDFGGLPAWLTTKTGMSYRMGGAAYSHYLDKYFRQVLPRLADLQVTRGGNIVLIQNENHYRITTMPDRLNYLSFVSQLFRRSGFDIPIITNNDFTAPAVPESIECVSGGREIIGHLKRMRLRQPNAPLLAIEFDNGGPDAWGEQHHVMAARATARRAMEILGWGGQYNYYMYHGGTNFGFWAGRLSGSGAAYGTASYDYDAPIAEGGGLTEKYYLTRPVNMLARHMGRFLASCTAPTPAATVADSTAIMNLSGPDASWAFVSNGGREEISVVRIALPEGRQLDVCLGEIGAAAVPYDLQLDPQTSLDYANVTPLGLFGENTLVFHADAGWEARISINGREIRQTVPKGTEPKIIEQDEWLVVLINTPLARRTWLADDTLIFGPRFVGETLEDIEHAAGAKQCAILPLDGGKLAHRKAPAGRVTAPAAPKLKPWKRISVCTEPVSEDLQWQKLDHPAAAEKLGIHQGYLWYRIAWQEARSRKRNLFLPDCEDRATVYLNGELVGLWGRGASARRDPLACTVRRGRNVLTLLVDNLGRASSGLRLGAAKGLFGHVYEAKALRLRKPRLKRLEKFPRRVVPRGMAHLVGRLDKLEAWSMEFDLPLSQVSPVHVEFEDVPHHVAIMCNDRPVGFFPSEGRNYGQLTLTAGLRKGKNALHVLLWGEVDEKIVERFSFHGLPETISQDAEWSYRPWQMPTPGGPVVGKNQPAWYAARFACRPQDGPLFVHVAGAKKGQIFLNGHNVGRFWTVGPQEYYYLPECWLEEDNELLFFVEQGDLPRRTRLEYRPGGPYR
ncbi:MAG: beta-galactosidase [Planctomycetes bacterium]|nr:beta-galactosidase [Planctomycetota bacterium]